VKRSFICGVLVSTVVAALAVARDVECPRPTADDWDVAPSFLDSVPIVYPPMDYMARVEGDVVVNVTILASGDPCRAVGISGPVPLLAPAIRAALQSRMPRLARPELPYLASNRSATRSGSWMYLVSDRIGPRRT
jgi:hypothetical protein